MRISDWSSDVCSSDLRLIGYDASPADTRRYTNASTITSDLFECRYPLREWGWDRAACIARIEAAQLPVPPKSSCFICGAMKPDEVRALPSWCLRLIVLVEARAAPRLRTVEGLDRKGLVWGKRVSVRVKLGGRRIMKNKHKQQTPD